LKLKSLLSSVLKGITRDLFGGAVGRRSRVSGYQIVFEQQENWIECRVAIDRIRILIAHYHESCALVETTRCSGVIVNIVSAINVISPKSNLVVVSKAVPVRKGIRGVFIGSTIIEDRRSWMTAQKVEKFAIDFHRNVPMRLGRKAKDIELGRIVVGVQITISVGKRASVMSFQRNFWKVRIFSSTMGYLERKTMEYWPG
jgi:hypothetical protein